jgi:uncharacterized protein YqcC (DUF446 family)
LHAIEALLRETALAGDGAGQQRVRQRPAVLPGYLEPLEWLQWVLIPRMHQLLESGQPLPQILPLRPIMKWRWIDPPCRESMLAELAAGCAVCR